MAALRLPDFQPQIERLNNHLRALPADLVTPSEETLRSVRAWEERVKDLAALIRDFDDVLNKLAALEVDEASSLEVPSIVAEVRARRAEAFVVMRRLNPSQAWFWTEEWQMSEREADADRAAGRTTTYESDEEFLEALRAHGPDADLRGS